MTGADTTTGVVAGASTGAAGVAVLPAAGDNTLLALLSATAVAAGTLVLMSCCVAWFVRRKTARSGGK